MADWAGGRNPTYDGVFASVLARATLWQGMPRRG